MADLTTKYAGLTLKNPVIAGASNLVTDPDVVKKLEDAGVAAIVYKSLFEEQIQLESYQMEEEMSRYDDLHAEMTSLFPDIEHAGPSEHLHQVEKLKKSVGIPVIASVNAVYEPTWGEYAQKLEETGADALEVNFFAVPKDAAKAEEDIVKEQLDVLSKIKSKVSIPVTVKLSPFYTNILKVVSDMDRAGADGFVLFNRLFQPDINIETETMAFPYNLTHPEENRLALRFMGLLYGQVKAGLCANGGIFDGKDVIKMILAGADAVQVVSTLYKNKPAHVGTMLKDIEQWMNGKDYGSLDDFRGKLSRKNINDPFAYKRAQYVDILLKSDEMNKLFPI